MRIFGFRSSIEMNDCAQNTMRVQALISSRDTHTLTQQPQTNNIGPTCCAAASTKAFVHRMAGSDFTDLHTNTVNYTEKRHEVRA